MTHDLDIALSPEQKAAVEHKGSALVVAGAGSGKTRTLTAKIVHLIRSGIAPERILAITFTNKAADEMKHRLVEMTGFSLDRFPWVRTYHSACYRILRTHCQLLGYQNPLQIYSNYQQEKLVKEILIRGNIDKKYFYQVSAHISHAKNSGDPDAYFDKNPRLSYFRLRDIFDRYEKSLMERNAVDFDNILYMTRELLRTHETIRKQYLNLFSYVLVDEYQDTNNLQEDLTRLLTGGENLFCVGDDWQAIYGFRGSNVNHFLSFAKNYENAKIFRLERNYRSASEIVDAANGLIRYNRQRMDKTCFSKKTGGSIEIQEFYSDSEEAMWVSDKIRRLHDAGIDYDQIAVLYRTKFCSLSFEKAFRYASIPYRMLGAKGFFERREILDITCYLTAAVFDKDDAAFERIINVPKRGIGPGTVKKIGEMKTEGESLQGAARMALEKKILSGKIYDALKHLFSILDEVASMSPDRAIRTILDRTGYLDNLKQSAKTREDYTAREENIEQLIYSASLKDSIVEYLEEASLIREDRKEEEEEGASQSAVNLATMHASKGLEFHAVFVAGCEENLLPHWKSKETDLELQEERRLMYVAMTRAAHCLFVSSANFRKGQFNPKSRFVDELLSPPLE